MRTSILLAIAGLLGLVVAAQTGDTRWIVGGILLLASAGAWWLRLRNRRSPTVSMILAVLGVGLMLVAYMRPLAAG